MLFCQTVVMLSRIIFLLLFVCALTTSAALHCRAQEAAPAPSPTPKNEKPQDEPLRVFTEEVRVPVFAYDDQGRFDPTLELDDLLVLEDGVPQQLKSIQRIPASVLLLLCTSGEINPAMRTNMTRDIALNLLASIREGDQLALLQFTNRVEVLQGWTTDKNLVEQSLRSKLHSGRGTRLAAAITKAAVELQKQPAGNRHLVIVTDGVDVPAWADAKELMQVLAPNEAEAREAAASFAQATRDLIAAQSTVHVISYQALAQQAMEGRQERSSRSGGARMSTGIRFDPAMRRLRKAYEKAMQKSGERLNSLVLETGGRLLLPTSAEELLAEGSEVARDIGAQYVITYTPKRPLATSPRDEYRRLTVAPRRIGLHIRTRRGYIVTAAS